MSPLKQIPSSPHCINISILWDGEEMSNWPKTIMLGTKTCPRHHVKCNLLSLRKLLPIYTSSGHMKGLPVSKTRDHLKNQSMKCSLLGETGWLGKQAIALGAVPGKGTLGQEELWLKGVRAQEENPLMVLNTHAINLDLWLITGNKKTVTEPHWEMSLTVMLLSGTEVERRRWGPADVFPAWIQSPQMAQLTLSKV